MKDKIVLITGGAKGIGLSTAKLLSKNNKVIIIDNDKIACEKLKKQDANIIVYYGDISNYNNMKNIINKIFLKYNNIDILINNAAIQTTTNIMKMKFEDWERVIDVNLNGTFIMTQLVSLKMKPKSTILNIISSHYNKPRTNRLHYDVSKAGVSMMTKGFALELSTKEITVNALAIGATYTTMNYMFDIDKNVEIEALSKIPMKKITTSDDIANYIEKILSGFSEFATGSIFVVDGGRNLL